MGIILGVIFHFTGGNEIILPTDIADACFAFVGGLLNKSTGNILNVDGVIANAFIR